MAIGTFTMYAANLNFINPAALAAGTVKCILVSSSYTPNFASNGNTILTNANSYEIANGNGYATGGVTLSSPIVTAITSGYKFSTSSASWTAAGGTIPAWRRAVFYYSGTLGGLVNPLIGAVLGDDAPADIPATPSGTSITLSCPLGGWFTCTVV